MAGRPSACPATASATATPTTRACPARRSLRPLNKYNSDLAGYEEVKRGGRRFRGDKSTEVRGETRNAISTRVLLGYLWTQSMLKKAGLSNLWDTLPKQTVTHMGRKVTGVLREENTMGAIEIHEDSSMGAVRDYKILEADNDDQADADDAFQAAARQLKVSTLEQDGEDGWQLKTKRVKHNSEDDDFMSV